MTPISFVLEEIARYLSQFNLEWPINQDLQPKDGVTPILESVRRSRKRPVARGQSQMATTCGLLYLRTRIQESGLPKTAENSHTTHAVEWCYNGCRKCPNCLLYTSDAADE